MTTVWAKHRESREPPAGYPCMKLLLPIPCSTWNLRSWWKWEIICNCFSRIMGHQFMLFLAHMITVLSSFSGGFLFKVYQQKFFPMTCTAFYYSPISSKYRKKHCPLSQKTESVSNKQPQNMIFMPNLHDTHNGICIHTHQETPFAMPRTYYHRNPGAKCFINIALPDARMIYR